MVDRSFGQSSGLKSPCPRLGFPDGGGSAQARELMIDAIGSQRELRYNYHKVGKK